MLQWSKVAIRIKRPRNKSRRLPLPSCSCKKSLWKVRMKLLVAVVLVAGLAGVAAWGGEAFTGDEHMGTCVFEKLTGQDYKFCRGDLEVFYPELGDVGCTYIPKCNQYRKRISKEWHSPKIAYPQADKNKKYVLIMVDPDAPNRANPKYRFWRHWVVIDIKVSLFLLCDLCRHLMMNLCDTTIIPIATHSVLGIGYPFHSRDNLRRQTGTPGCHLGILWSVES
ncbi:phosphatidylethanolamine-binding protein 4 isoform X2 [Mauremys mutica]|uniref:phosphatidylethanolamine-binding protein 4 isoform X2 n=1 Tax=Mauremys mutica TaxID=74926 RepID=UPI001D16AEEA|nr:phosphatidylethanolamine-binding protein 4 isoform X2 [Mauremys mutica]